MVYISKLSPLENTLSYQMLAANSGDSYNNYANLMFDLLCAKVEEIIEKINEIIDILNRSNIDIND